QNGIEARAQTASARPCCAIHERPPSAQTAASSASSHAYQAKRYQSAFHPGTSVASTHTPAPKSGSATSDHQGARAASAVCNAPPASGSGSGSGLTARDVKRRAVVAARSARALARVAALDALEPLEHLVAQLVELDVHLRDLELGLEVHPVLDLVAHAVARRLAILGQQ